MKTRLHLCHVTPISPYLCANFLATTICCNPRVFVGRRLSSKSSMEVVGFSCTFESTSVQRGWNSTWDCGTCTGTCSTIQLFLSPWEYIFLITSKQNILILIQYFPKYEAANTRVVLVTKLLVSYILLSFYSLLFCYIVR